MTATTKLKVGIATLEEYKARTIAIAKGEIKPSPDEPKVWFQSLDTLAKVLSKSNRELLAVIAETNPASLDELSAKTGRAVPNLSRTLRTMETYGLVHFEQGPHRKLAPRVDYTGVELAVSF
jgi:predicted transcriptional regulator